MRSGPEMRLSIITPAYNETMNLPALYERLVQVLTPMRLEWEWLIVDDHSPDETFDVVEHLALRDPRVSGIRLSRNSGSHAAIACGLHHVSGDAAVMMAADFQDPPETIGPMLDRWRHGAQVVWAVRREQPGKAQHASFAAIYYWIMRRVVGMRDMPAKGADFFLIDRAVIDAFRQFSERNFSVLALILWLGFRQEYFEYDKQKRAAGTSGWTLAKKVKLVVDSITSFSGFPIRLCSYVGLALLAAGLLLGITGLVLLPALGAGLILVAAVVTGLTGLQLVALGIVGEYVWRALDEARGRPRWIVERTTLATASRSAEKLG
jgi:polyisoprenyl-phosphate glycosyltransferase